MGEERLPKKRVKIANFHPTGLWSRFCASFTVNVSLRILNTLGQVVATLVNETREAGYYQVPWNANVSRGVYFYRLQAGEFAETKKMILLQ